LKVFFELLYVAENLNDAICVQDTIKEIWKAHKDEEMSARLDDGTAELLRGNKEKALTIFDEIIKSDAEYFEAWSKKSTCHFMLGEMEESQEAALTTLDLQPLHFQALNGLGLVFYEKKDYKKALETFRKSLSLDPWSPVSSKLSSCIDMERSG